MKPQRRLIDGVVRNFFPQDIRAEICGPGAPSGTYMTASIAAAEVIGRKLGERAVAKGLTAVQWTRPRKYHGKTKAFIDAVRAAGIQTLKGHPRNTIPGPDHQRAVLRDVLKRSENERGFADPLDQRKASQLS